MLLGDMHFDCSTTNVGFQIFKPFVDEYSLFDCDLLTCTNGQIDYTFHQEGSGKNLILIIFLWTRTCITV